MFSSSVLVFLLLIVANVVGDRGKFDRVNGMEHFSLVHKETNATFIIPGKHFYLAIRSYGPIYIEDMDFHMNFGGCDIPVIYYNTSNNPRLLIRFRIRYGLNPVLDCKILFEWVENTPFYEINVAIRSDHGMMLLIEASATVNSLVEEPPMTTTQPPPYIVSVDMEEIPPAIVLCVLAVMTILCFFIVLNYGTKMCCRRCDIKYSKQRKRKELIGLLNEIPEPPPKKKKKKKKTTPEPIQQLQPVPTPLATTASISFHRKDGSFEPPKVVEDLKTAIETPDEMKTAIELQKPDECHTAVALVENPNAPTNPPKAP